MRSVEHAVLLVGVIYLFPACICSFLDVFVHERVMLYVSVQTDGRTDGQADGEAQTHLTQGVARSQVNCV